MAMRRDWRSRTTPGRTVLGSYLHPPHGYRHAVNPCVIQCPQSVHSPCPETCSPIHDDARRPTALSRAHRTPAEVTAQGVHNGAHLAGRISGPASTRALVEPCTAPVIGTTTSARGARVKHTVCVPPSSRRSIRAPDGNIEPSQLQQHSLGGSASPTILEGRSRRSRSTRATAS